MTESRGIRVSVPRGVRYTRSELSHIVATRRGNVEGQGDHAYIDLTVRVTPELLESLLGGIWEARDGKRSRLEAVYVSGDGLTYPEFTREASE